MMRFRIRLVTLTVVAGLAALVALIALMAPWDGPTAQAGHGIPPIPHATIKIWSPNAVAGPSFGNDPNMTVTDPAGATAQVATAGDPLTIVTVYENTSCSGLPCGVTYWNPETDVFRCYGYSGGAMTGVDVNRSAPVKTGPGGTTYGPGDTWLAKSGGFSPAGPGGARPLTVQFPGTDNFRSWGAGNLSSVAVDQATGLIWYTATDSGGVIGLFDPATNVTKRWTAIGGVPRDIEVDSAGRAYATVGPAGVVGDEIVRVDPATNQVKRWAIPAVGHAPPSLQGSFAPFSQNPNGITIDSAGRIWFAETISDEMGRLDPSANDADSTAADEIAEYKKVQPSTGINTINEPQNLATSGSGGLLQTFFSEGTGNAVGIITQVEATGTSQETLSAVTPTTSTVIPAESTLTPADHTHVPTQKVVPPVTFDVPGVDGVPGSGATTTAGPDGIPGNADDEVIPGILRFPMPAGSFKATGMTEVGPANTVHGSLIGTEQMFQVTSGAIIAPEEEPEPEIDKFFDPPKGEPGQGPDRIEIGQPTTTGYSYAIEYENSDPDNPPARLVDTVTAEFDVASATVTPADLQGNLSVFLTSKGKGNSSTKITLDLPPGPQSARIDVVVETRPLPNGKRFKPTSCGLVPLNSSPVFVFEVDPGTGDIGRDAEGNKIVLAGPSVVLDIVAVEDPSNPDNDGDGIPNDEEARDFGTDPCSADTDADGLADLFELTISGTNPLILDTDADGLSDGDIPAEGLGHEFCELAFGSDPLSPDTDGDGLTDGLEVLLETDPLNPDTDGDGLTDYDEVTVNTDPLNPDTDGDGVLDGVDADPLDPGVQ